MSIRKNRREVVIAYGLYARREKQPENSERNAYLSKLYRRAIARMANYTYPRPRK